ncbi:MAG: hypothetical protein QMD11_05150 [Smithella sp.]|nr:hypothetical protein [Smithella sp.]
MSKVIALIFVLVQMYIFPLSPYAAPIEGQARYIAGKEISSAGKPDILVNGAIDLLVGSYDKKSPFYDPVFSEAVKRDIRQLLISSRALVLNDDLEKIINSLDAILALNDSNELSRNTLAKYLKQIVKGMKPLAEADTLKKLLLTIASADKEIFAPDSRVIDGLIMMSEGNMYGQKRTSAAINTSALRALLYMIACADFSPHLVVQGKDTGIPILPLLDSFDRPDKEPGTVKDQTANLAEWFIGEIVTAVKWGREGKLSVNGKYVHMDQFQAFDWLMFKKKYVLTGVGVEPLKFDGIVGIISNELVESILPASIIDAFPSIIELGGGMTVAEYNRGRYDGFTATSWQKRHGTAGKRHKLLALFVPVMEFWWNAKDIQGRLRVGELVHMLASLNEIPVAGYIPMENGASPDPLATFRNDEKLSGKSVLKTIEDSGFLKALLRKRSPDDTGLAPPLMDLCFRVIDKLNSPWTIPDDYLRMNPNYRGKTYLDFAFFELDRVSAALQNKENKTGQDFLDRAFEILFVPMPGEKNSIMTKLGAVVRSAAQISRDRVFAATFKRDLGNLLNATDTLVATADVEQILRSLNAVLALNDHLDFKKNTLAKFVHNALLGLSPISDGDTIKGLLVALADLDAKAVRDTAELNDDLIMILSSNMYGQKLGTSGVRTSALRTLLFMIQAADVEQHLVLAGIDTGIPMLKMVDSPDHPYNEPGTVRDQTVNIAQWAIGEVATAIKWGREGKVKLNGKNVFMDTFQAFDWVMFKKRYHLTFAGLKILSFDGMSGMLSSKLVNLFMPSAITDAFPAFVDMGGGMTDAEYANSLFSGFTDKSWKERYGTAGRRHKFLAIAAPLMEFCWNAKDENGKQRSGDLVQVLAGLNEIPMPPAYVELARGRGATFRRDDHPSVIKAVEDSGLLVYLIKKRGENDIVVPALDLLITVVGKLNQKDSASLEYRKNRPDFEGNTLLDVLFAEMDIKGFKQNQTETADTIQRILDIVFSAGEGETRNAVSRLQDYLDRSVGYLYKSPSGN